MNYIRTARKEIFKGKRVLLRTDFNVPISEGEVVGDFRILKTLPTIEFLRDAGAKLIIMSHLGGENGKTLAPIATYLSRFTDIVFAPDIRSSETRHVINSLSEGEAILLENVRSDKGEEENDPEFAKFLASFGDVYVNDAFAACHRAHASIVGIPQLLPSYAGLLLEEELLSMKEALNPPHPFLFILGGAKFDTKLPLLKKFLPIADHIFVGGALAHNILKARGFEVGASVVSTGDFDIKEIAESDKVIVPSEVIVRRGDEVLVKQMGEIEAIDKIVDAGEATIATIKEKIEQAKFIVWNGPLGNYEDGFSEGTNKLARVIYESKTETLLGGGDTLTAIQKMGAEENSIRISTGGGAMLDYLVSETLPGIEALNRP